MFSPSYNTEFSKIWENPFVSGLLGVVESSVFIIASADILSDNLSSVSWGSGIASYTQEVFLWQPSKKVQFELVSAMLKKSSTMVEDVGF